MNLYWYNIVITPLLQTITIIVFVLISAELGDVLVEWIDQWKS